MNEEAAVQQQQPNYGLVGLTVLYRLTHHDVTSIIDQRAKGNGTFLGNSVRDGELVPMIITEAWSTEIVNGQLILDGNDSLWVTSVNRGDQRGEWDYR